MLPFRRGDVAVQIGQFGDGFAQQRATRITAAGVFDVDKRLVGGGQPAGNLTPDRLVRTIVRTIAVVGGGLGRSLALHLAT